MILITRPLLQSLGLQTFFQSHGLSSHVEPLISIVPLTVQWPDVSDYRALITTSAQAIRAMGARYVSASIPLWCVGKESARVALDLGYTPIISQRENALSLIEDLKKAYTQEKTRLLYISSAVISVNLHTILNDYLLTCDRVVVYDAIPSSEFSSLTMELFQKNKIKIILLYSQQAAYSFKECFKKSKNDLSFITVLCKSEKVLKAVNDLKWGSCLCLDPLSNSALLKKCKQINGH